MDKRSAWIVASVFGEISPKIKIKIVSIPVAIPAPRLPKRRIAREVVRLDAERFTMLFPIRIALNILPESAVIFKTLAAFGFPSSANVRIRIWFTVVSAVSAEEKKAGSSNNRNKIIS